MILALRNLRSSEPQTLEKSEIPALASVPIPITTYHEVYDACTLALIV